MYVSLPHELENMVKQRVDSGIYGSASEVVRVALRKFFHVSEEDPISPEEKERIKEIVELRLVSLNNGTAKLHKADDIFAEIDKKYFE